MPPITSPQISRPEAAAQAQASVPGGAGAGSIALPQASVIKIGGPSVIDRGRAAVNPLLEEIVAARKAHKLLIGTGAGTRARHLYSIAAELNLPAGVLAQLGALVANQNAEMLGQLLAQ